MNNNGQKILSKPGVLAHKTRREIEEKIALVQEKWQEVSLSLPKRIATIEEKLSRATKFLEELEELSVWMSATRDLLEKQEEGGSSGLTVDPEVLLFYSYCSSASFTIFYKLFFNDFHLIHPGYHQVTLSYFDG